MPAPKVLPMTDSLNRAALSLALNQVRNVRSFTTGYGERYKIVRRDINIFSVQRLEKYTQSLDRICAVPDRRAVGGHHPSKAAWAFRC